MCALTSAFLKIHLLIKSNFPDCCGKLEILLYMFLMEEQIKSRPAGFKPSTPSSLWLVLHHSGFHSINVDLSGNYSHRTYSKCITSFIFCEGILHSANSGRGVVWLTFCSKCPITTRSPAVSSSSFSRRSQELQGQSPQWLLTQTQWWLLTSWGY